MKVVNALKTGEYTLTTLETELGIKSKVYDSGLIVLNYDQINSPKTHPIVIECRGLILDSNFDVVSRSLDRFFNIGEAPDTQIHLDFDKAVCFDKVDGSLIKIYNYNNVWYVSTRGTAYAESEVNGFDVTFRDLVFKALDTTNDEFQSMCNQYMNKDFTYVNELTCFENRVVTRYDGYTLWHLATRNNKTGEFVKADIGATHLDHMPIKSVLCYKFRSKEDIVNGANKLPNLQEGYVVYQDGIPVCKVKSNTYVVAHKIRGENGITFNSIRSLIVENEQDEYLAYFPEDEIYFTEVISTYNKLISSAVDTFEKTKHIESQKEFALAVNDFTYKPLLFSARKNNSSISKELSKLTNDQKIKLLVTYENKLAA